MLWRLTPKPENEYKLNPEHGNISPRKVRTKQSMKSDWEFGS